MTGKCSWGLYSIFLLSSSSSQIWFLWPSNLFHHAMGSKEESHVFTWAEYLLSGQKHGPDSSPGHHGVRHPPGESASGRRENSRGYLVSCHIPTERFSCRETVKVFYFLWRDGQFSSSFSTLSGPTGQVFLAGFWSCSLITYYQASRKAAAAA